MSRFAARKHDICIQEFSYGDVLRLALYLMVLVAKCPANLPGLDLFNANENYLCHETVIMLTLKERLTQRHQAYHPGNPLGSVSSMPCLTPISGEFRREGGET